MNIEVNVNDITLDSVIDGDDEGAVRLREIIGVKLAHQIIGSDAWPTLSKRITDIRDEEIRKLVLPAITKAFESPLQKTNNWGDPVGEPVTLRDVIVQEARKILNGTRDRYDARTEPLGRKLIREMVEREIRKELANAINAEREKVVAAVRAQAADLIAKAVAQGVGA
ncbi:hypothetical protein [Actinomadura rudentiformis]|uniref:Uncharacterized protein n=1 Tax=Actinomadura rudentiformis TaxID=359158 RepID=A0A6H9YUI3_9ACTN|nr:hypothetical protein [Actinomadura rudentiformis]KAB2347316.1 hypothetical protein F8566_20100 [Actinomadura rudentiformis]